MVAEPIDVRAEFDAFFESAYPWLASQLRAITGDAETARWAVDTAFVRCWQSWASVRRLPDPLNWVRWTAIRATVGGPRNEFPLRRRAPEPSAITADSEEAVVLEALHRLPQSQRRAIVLHYMGDVTVAELALRSGTTPDAVEWLLDTGFDTLVGLLTWPDEPGAAPDPGPADGSVDPRYDWTAEALGDTATRLAADVTVPAPASVLQRAAVLRWARRALPIAVSAACVSGVVLLAAQLKPADSTAPRTPHSYTEAARAPFGEAPAAGTVPVVAIAPGAAAPEVPLGTSIVAVARSTPLQDFGISAPTTPTVPAPAGGPVARRGSVAGPAGSGGSTAGTAGGAATGGAGGNPAPQAGGGTTPPREGGPTTVSPTTIPPTTVPPTTVPPTTVPPTTVPPTTVPPTTVPPTSTTPPPTTEPTTTPTTTEAPVTTTTVAETTRATTTRATPTSDPASTTEAATTTTRATTTRTAPPTTTADPTTTDEPGS